MKWPYRQRTERTKGSVLAEDSGSRESQEIRVRAQTPGWGRDCETQVSSKLVNYPYRGYGETDKMQCGYTVGEIILCVSSARVQEPQW